jgi:hypothetical protein
LKNKILPKFQKEGRSSARLLSYCFSIEVENLSLIKHKENEKTLAIYEYKKLK